MAPTALLHSSHTDSPLEEFVRDPGAALHATGARLAHGAASWGLLTAALLLCAVTALLGVRWGCHRRLRRTMSQSARLIALLPPPAVEPAGAAALWANLVGLLGPAWRRWWSGQPHLVWEYVFDRESVALRLWVPGGIPPGMIERAVESAWPGTHTRTHPAPPPLPRPSPGAKARKKGAVVSGELRLARGHALPVRAEFPTDPLRALLGVPAGLGAREQALVQVLARPATGRRLQRARHTGDRSQSPRAPRLVFALLDALTPRPRSRPKAPTAPHRLALEHSAQDRAVVAKQRGPAYETRIRYAVTASPTAKDLAHSRERLRGTAHGLASAYAAYSDHNYYRRTHPFRLRADLDGRRLRRGDLLSVPELAALAHLPWDATVRGLERAGARAIPPPPGMPSPGRSVKPIGRATAGRARRIGVRVSDARQHLHILGATGSGKSELMARMILADAAAGRGLVVIDPKGDLVTDVLDRLPVEAGERVVLFDAESTYPPPVLNPLEGADAAHSVDNLVTIFSRIYTASWGPRTDDILRAGLLTLCALPGTPLLTGLPQLLAIPAFRHRAIGQLNDEILRGFWVWFEDLSPAGRSQVTAPLMNKLRGVLLRPFVRGAIAAGPSTVDMDRVLDGGICLVRIARDALGADTANLLGSIIVARTWQAATRRARLPQAQRRDCGLYIDEAHNFLHLPYPLGDMLAEARGYRLSLTLAHQYLRQLPRELEEGISTNARTKIFFNSSPEDARQLAPHTEPRLAAHDLSNLDAFHTAVRPVLHGAEAPAFTAVTEQLPPPVHGRNQQIRAAARRNAQQGVTPAVGAQRNKGPDPRRGT
ncbi:DUF87 domain-containing protein [Streptomyces sp. ODS28]|uniref:helicase HerA domain-containing protein n=1 Tax=Streptomyces sp. ODS28 TaxID=3136688 RepID=UPI0031ECD56B